MNKIYCISDLHMGDGGRQDNFKGREEKLKLFLAHVKKDSGELIILGDLFEFWQCSVGNALNSSARKPIIKLLDELNATYILGNHDVDLLGLSGVDWFTMHLFQNMVSSVERTINGERYLFKHGHDVDINNCGDTPSKGRLATIFAGMIEDATGVTQLENGISVEDALVDIFKSKKLDFSSMFIRDIIYQYSGVKWLYEHAYAFFQKDEVRQRKLAKAISLTDAKVLKDERALYPFIKGILFNIVNTKTIGTKELISELYKQKESSRVSKIIVGHTHEPGNYEDWYWNSGSWVNETNDVLVINGTDNPILMNWNGNELIPTPRLFV